MWGLVLSALTIAGSLVAKKEKPSERVLSTHPILSDIFQAENRIFLSGVVLGMGCSLMYSTIVSQLRLVERFRMLCRYCLNTDETIELFPLRQPKSIHDESNGSRLLSNAAECTDDGSIRLLITPATAATSNLHVSLITIEPGREITSCKAPAVEFYYVISCPLTGSNFSQQGVIETSSLKAGDCFVVNVGSMRWISNIRGSSPLILLRATDGGERYSRVQSTEQIRLDAQLKLAHNKGAGISRVSTMERLKDGLRQVQSMAMKYVSSFSTIPDQSKDVIGGESR